MIIERRVEIRSRARQTRQATKEMLRTKLRAVQSRFRISIAPPAKKRTCRPLLLI